MVTSNAGHSDTVMSKSGLPVKVSAQQQITVWAKQNQKKRVFIMNRMQKELIQSDPFVMMGKPVIAGTRITVELILEKLAAGETFEQILDAHLRLTCEAIQAALAFAAEALRADVVYPITEVAV